MTKSWAYGAALVVAAHLLWFVLIFTEAHIDWVMPVIIVMFFVVMNIACLGAFVTALHAPRHGLILAISMAPLTALLATVSNLLLQLTGTHVDLSGFHGNLGMFAVSLAYGVFTSAVGGGIGLWVVRRRAAPAAAIATPVTPALDPPPPT